MHGTNQNNLRPVFKVSELRQYNVVESYDFKMYGKTLIPF